MPHPNPEFTQADLDAARGPRRTPPTDDGPRTTKEDALEHLAALKNRLAGGAQDDQLERPPPLTLEDMEAPF